LSQTPDYSIGHPIISKYEKELIDSLPQLYPDEGEMLIVETVLIPHFRAKLQEVFDDFLEARSKGPVGKKCDVPVTSHEIPELCSRIDKMIKGNRELLASDTIFKPALKMIQQSRAEARGELNEESKQSFICTLATYEITDRQSLLKKGVDWFMSKEAKFPPYGAGYAFIKAILGRSVGHKVTLKILDEVADKLGFKKLTEQDERQKQLELLAGYGITDRQSLRKKGPEWFASKEAKFPPYGAGYAFIKAILGRSVRPITLEILEEAASALGFDKLSERPKQLELLAGYGITDRQSLLKKGVNWFTKEAQFPPYGGGKAFIKAILGRSVGHQVTLKILEEVADKLGFDKLSERPKPLELLAGYGITDRQSLLKKKADWFNSKEAKFPPYGGGYAFIKAILGRSVGHKVTLKILEEVADKLGFLKT